MCIWWKINQINPVVVKMTQDSETSWKQAIMYCWATVVVQWKTLHSLWVLEAMGLITGCMYTIDIEILYQNVGLLLLSILKQEYCSAGLVVNTLASYQCDLGWILCINKFDMRVFSCTQVSSKRQQKHLLLCQQERSFICSYNLFFIGWHAF